MSSSTARPLRVAIDARMAGGITGGVESVTIGLASGLSSLTDGTEEYLFLVSEGDDAWIRPFLAGPARPLVIRRSLKHHVARAVPPVAAVWRMRPWRPRDDAGPPSSDGTIERARVDVMHLLAQSGFLTDVPTIYHPHDLQHLHLPQFFTPKVIARRELWYRTLCQRAAMVAVTSSWTKEDVEAAYAIDEHRVQVVPFAPPAGVVRVAAEDAAAMQRRLALPEHFVLYPAQTWPHKNHIGLLRALARLRAGGLVVPLVASGRQSEFFPKIRREMQELGLQDQVRWLGFVSQEELAALYQGATAVVVPTRFEAASGPVWEAFEAGAAVACSNVTSLPAQAGDAALLFDPDDTAGMAEAIRVLWTDPDVRSTLVTRGKARVAQFTWERTARHFRAHYRRIAGRELTEADRVLIQGKALL